jgi:LPXTG-motif cell wall-anchored protein
MPEEAGKTLSFPTLQTYDSGRVVRWIGPPDAEKPAPRVTLTAAEGHGVAASAEPGGTAEAGGAPMELGLAALALGGLGLAGGGASVARRRRRE